MIHQAGQELHRQILEGERGPVKQLQHERIRGELHQRRHRRMAEPVISVMRHAGEFRSPAGYKPRDYFAGDIGIGAAGESRHCRGVDRRPRLGHVEAAIVRQARKGDVDEAKRRSLASGRDVTHAPSLNFDQPSEHNCPGRPPQSRQATQTIDFPGVPGSRR